MRREAADDAEAEEEFPNKQQKKCCDSLDDYVATKIKHSTW